MLYYYDNQVIFFSTTKVGMIKNKFVIEVLNILIQII